MTWHYEISSDASTLTVTDHTGTVVAEITNSGPGFSIPDDILAAMRAEVEAEGLQDGLSQRQIAILADAIFEDIEEGPPP